jgi:octaprenyl-diphosphate synthase
MLSRMTVIIPLNRPHGWQTPPDHDEALRRLTAHVADDIAAVNQMIVDRAESRAPLIPQLAGHIIAAGGKRLRPVLALACAKLCGYEGTRHRKLAACVEFIHTATLLHDDVVDASDMRRGLPSANAAFGCQASVLVGDFLFSRAFQLMVEDGSIDVMRILSNASAVIAEGEVLQLTISNDTSTGEQAYLDVVRAKTAEMFAAACRIGAVIEGRPAADEEALRAFGLNFGIAYQIVDDVLDYEAEQDRLGKTVGDDFREGKITLPVILAMHRCNEAERVFWRRTMDDRNVRGNDFAHAQDILRRHNALRDSLDRARHYAAVARDALGVFPDHPVKQALLDMAAFAADRRR